MTSTTREDSKPDQIEMQNSQTLIAFFIDNEILRPFESLSLLNSFSDLADENIGIKAFLIQTPTPCNKTELRNLALDLRASTYIAFLEPKIKINKHLLRRLASEVRQRTDIDCYSLEETQVDGIGGHKIIHYGIGNPLESAPSQPNHTARRPANPRCIWRAELVSDLKFKDSDTAEEFNLNEFEWSLKAAARCQTSQHLSLATYTLE